MNKLKRLLELKNLLLTIVFLVITSFCISQTNITLDASADSWIWENEPNSNYGNDHALYIGRDNGVEMNNMLFEWDLSSLPNCIEVTSAEIQLYQWSDNSGYAGGNLKRITESWNESTVTWANQPNTSGDYGIQSFNSTPGWKYIPATDLVKDWLEFGNDGVMFVATSSSTDYQICNSRENVQKNPKLKITYIDGTYSTSPSSATANPNPVNQGESTTLTVIGGSLGTGASWEWYKDNCGGSNHVGSGSTIMVTPTEDSEYYVRAEGDCNTTDCASVFVDLLFVSINENSGNDLINIFPNPIKETLTIEIEKPINGIVFIYNTIGQKILTTEINKSNSTLALSNIQKGIYFIKITDINGNLLITKKILKE